MKIFLRILMALGIALLLLFGVCLALMR